MSSRLFVVSGPSGSGKSSIIAGVRSEIDIEFSVSATTRLPRPGEVNGRDYHFVSRRGFQEMIEDGELLEWATYNNHMYGTPVGPIDEATGQGRDVLLDIEIQGARQVKENRPESVMIFVAAPSMDVLERRLRDRGDTSEEDIAARLAIAAGQLEVANELFDRIVVNDTLNDAVDELVGIISDST